jgi:uncharacterized Zn-binding protein involved in type VI secretion
MKKEKMKKYLFNWRSLSIGIIVAIIVIISTIAGNTTSLYVNGKDITKQGEPVYRGGVLYLPIESIVTGMGDSFVWAKKPQTATVRVGEKKVMITVGKSVVYVDGKTLAVSVLELEGTKVPNQASPIAINNKMYAPYDFFKIVLNYPVEVKKEGSKEVVTVGTKTTTPTTPTTTPTPTSKPSVSVKEDSRYPFPDGWTPPQITSTWSSDKQKNMQVLENELEFKNLGAGASFSPYGGVGTTAIGLNANSKNEYDTMITISVWKGSQYTPLDHKIPYIAKELFEFYLPQDGDKIWKIADDAFNGKNVDSYLDKIITYETRQIKLMNVKGSLVIILGKPGVKYDNEWKIIK